MALVSAVKNCDPKLSLGSTGQLLGGCCQAASLYGVKAVQKFAALIISGIHGRREIHEKAPFIRGVAINGGWEEAAGRAAASTGR